MRRSVEEPAGTGGRSLPRPAHVAARGQQRGRAEFYVDKGLPADKIDVIPNGVEPRRRGRTHPGTAAGRVGPAREKPADRPGRAALAAEAGERRDLGGRPAEGDPRRRASADHRRRPAARSAPHVFATRWRSATRFIFSASAATCARLLPHFDVLWSTSGYEGQSNAILEAMAAGVPVVATDIPGTRDLVVPDETGYLAPIGDRAGFAR